MTLPLCILHAGAEKTGSTSLQHFLWLNEAALAAQKIWVPRALLRDPNQTVYNHEALCTASRFTRDEPDDLQKLRGLDSVAAVHAHREELVQSLAAERAALNFTPERILVSNEHVHGRLRAPEDLARARALLTPFCGAFHVVAYLRRQDEMARSYAAMAVRQGAASLRLIPDFATHGYDEVLGLDELHFDFAAFLDRLGATFGQEALNVPALRPARRAGIRHHQRFFRAYRRRYQRHAAPAPAKYQHQPGRLRAAAACEPADRRPSARKDNPQTGAGLAGPAYAGRIAPGPGRGGDALCRRFCRQQRDRAAALVS